MKRRLIAVLVCGLICLLGLVPGLAQKKTEVIIWGLNTTVPGGAKQQWEEFNAIHPNIKLIAQQQAGIAGQTLSSVAKLMIAIAAGTPPDITTIDRFMAASWASRGLLSSLDDLIKADEFPMSDFYKSCADEAKFNDKYFAIPNGTDNRGLYWNKDIFAEVGLDPEKPPNTWSEAIEYSKKLSKWDAKGNVIRIGFVPCLGALGIGYDNSWLYLYGWQNDGRFMSQDGRTCTLNDPYIVEALEWMVKCSDVLGGADKIKGFGTTFQSEAQDPFLIGKTAMKVDGNWALGNIARYAPQLNFAVAPAPVPDDRYYQKGRFKGEPKFITWSGGWSWGIPTGVKKVDEAWTVVKWLCSLPGFVASNRGDYEYNLSMNRPFVVGMSSRKSVDQIQLAKYSGLLTGKQAERLIKANKFFFDLMEVSMFRPLTPVATELWDWHVRTVEQASYHKKTPREALDYGTRQVQKRIDELVQQGLIK